jgi:hypothetical protein
MMTTNKEKIKITNEVSDWLEDNPAKRVTIPDATNILIFVTMCIFLFHLDFSLYHFN